MLDLQNIQKKNSFFIIHGQYLVVRLNLTHVFFYLSVKTMKYLAMNFDETISYPLVFCRKITMKLRLIGVAGLLSIVAFLDLVIYVRNSLGQGSVTVC